MSKIMKCAANDDIVTLRSQEDGDTITFLFESPSMYISDIHTCKKFILKDWLPSGQERQSEFEIKLMDLDIEHLGIPVESSSSTICLCWRRCVFF